MREQGPIKDNAVVDSTVGVFVSLYLIILAFFIVLNVVSNQVQSKSSAVIDSVNSTFREKYNHVANELKVPDEARFSSPNRDFPNRVESLLFSELEIENRYVSHGGRQLRVNIDAGDIFLPNSTLLNPNIGDALSKLVALLRDMPNDELWEFVFFFGYGADINAPNAQARQMLAIKRAGVLARHLFSLDAPPGSYTTGVRATDETMITAVFRSSLKRDSAIALKRVTKE